MQNPDIQALADALCRQAGLIGPWGRASPQMVALMQLTASRCLDILHGSAQDAPRSAEIARRFGTSATANAGHGDLHCRAVLVGATRLNERQKDMAEAVFVEAMRQKLGGMSPLFRDHADWSDDAGSDGGRRWRAASELAWVLVEERLQHAGAPSVEHEAPGHARFEIEFIHELA